MGSGGGGGDGGMMIMMMLMQQQMEQQRREQERQMEEQAFQTAQRAEGQNFQRYQDLITAQNKKVGAEWDKYNQNIDKILKINPGWNSQKKYVFNPYSVSGEYKKASNRQEADANTDLLNTWYSNLDKQSFDDYTKARKQFELSKSWLAEAQAAQDAGDRVLGNAPPGTWGAGGEMVSGGAGADAEKDKGAASAVGDASGMADVFKNFASGAAPGAMGSGGAIGMGAGPTGSGFLGEEKGGNDNLAGVFGKAIGAGGGGGKQAGYSIF